MGILSESSLGTNMVRLARQEYLKCKYHSLNDLKYLFCGGTGAQLNSEKMTENNSVISKHKCHSEAIFIGGAPPALLGKLRNAVPVHPQFPTASSRH